MSVTGSVSLTLSATQTNARDLGSAQDTATLSATMSLIAGAAGAAAVDRGFIDQRALVASANEDLDLVGTALTDIFGQPVSFAKIKALAVKALASNTNNVVVGAAASNAWTGLLNSTGTITLRPGAMFAVVVGSADATGYSTVPSTGDLLRVANGGAGTPVDYQIFVVGTNA